MCGQFELFGGSGFFDLRFAPNRFRADSVVADFELQAAARQTDSGGGAGDVSAVSAQDLGQPFEIEQVVRARVVGRVIDAIDEDVIARAACRSGWRRLAHQGGHDRVQLAHEVDGNFGVFGVAAQGAFVLGTLAAEEEYGRFDREILDEPEQLGLLVCGLQAADGDDAELGLCGMDRGFSDGRAGGDLLFGAEENQLIGISDSSGGAIEENQFLWHRAVPVDCW